MCVCACVLVWVFSESCVQLCLTAHQTKESILMSKCRKPNEHTHSHTAAKSTTTTTQQVYTPSVLDVLRQFMYAWNKSQYIPARDLSNSIFGLLPETEKPSQSNTICNLLNRLQWAQIERLFACNMRISFSPILCLFVSSFICRSTKPVEIDFYILWPWGFRDFKPFCYCLISTNFLFHHRTVLFFAFFPKAIVGCYDTLYCDIQSACSFLRLAFSLRCYRQRHNITNSIFIRMKWDFIMRFLLISLYSICLKFHFGLHVHVLGACDFTMPCHGLTRPPQPSQ